MVSLKDIAQRCGVSVATVSKALNGQPDIGENTRVRVLRAADELGYMANAAARALKTNRTYNIGVLFVDNRHSGLAHEFFSTVLDSLRVEAERSGYDITFINSNLGNRPCSILQHCLYRGVDGVVIVTANFRDPMVIELVESELPVVTIDHVFNNRAAILSDNVEGTEALVRYAASMGHRRIAFIHGELTSLTNLRLVGFHRACENLGISVPDEYIRESDYHDTEGCYRVCRELLELPERPDCILFPDDYSYIGGMNAIHDAGLRIPQDISVMGYDGINLSQVISPRLATYRQNTGELGRLSASKLIELIERPKTALLDRVIVSGELLAGESVSRIT
ncbi:MAG: LacI family transcriptional regulator [Ruminococcaceae bacterium]|nr:LacI family transcriptional regulator [Oscillospiraceae bacterium]